MCGFAGVVTWDEKYRVTRDTLEKMSRAIAHRGPDGEGYHLTRENESITPDTPQIGLAFRRLAILDPDPRSNQPFHIGPLTLVFNGEIYNFRDLKSEISKLRPDYRWRTMGDTEVLLMAYEVWRENCVEKLNGMFAFAVWDEAKKALFLARDRMGQKPLYVAVESDRAVFGSELGALRVLIPRRDPRSWVGGYLAYGYLGSAGAYSCTNWAPGFSDTITHLSEGESASRYFVCDSSFLRLPPEVPQVRERVIAAVQRQLVSDVPLGVFLSGGMDSSVVAYCARLHGDVRTFSISFDDPRYDESQYARAVANHLGTTHQEFRIAPSIIEDLPKLAGIFGEPFADSSEIPTHYLCRETRNHVKVTLSGDGADELFGGYERYSAMQLASHRAIRRLPKVVARILAGVARPMSYGHPKSRLTRAARFFTSLPLDDASRYERYVNIFDFDRIAALLDIPHDPMENGEIAAWYQMFRRDRDSVEAALATDRWTYLPNDLLTKVDRCSMLHGLEVRSPFMDHELVQFAAGLTTDQLLKGGPKRMLREAFAKDLPDFVFKRKKMGFAVPIGEWFRGELRPMLRDNLFAANAFGRTHFNMKVVERMVEEHETERVDHSQRLYALLMLELWWQQQAR